MAERFNVIQHPRNHHPHLPGRPRYKAGFRAASRLFVMLTSRFTVTGIEHLPPPPFILTMNHIQHPDAICLAAALPLQLYGLGAEKLRGTLMEVIFSLGAPIWIKQDTADRRALTTALRVLAAGHALAMSPEGHRSHTPGLLPGKDGAAYLATRTGVPIVPAGISGTHLVLRRLRPPVRLVIGRPFYLPQRRANAAQLRDHTEQIMCAIASLLPEAYHGVYAGNPRIAEMSRLVR